eukprot:CAMPEP_0201134592 /NCGR_PEP_ID=MMETSP0850-20130426/52068_1 /ASSEMBLY_ACC=CAM_ASM_000622 /TAXON_ID=183588 /ORGANISM="Pseudo-nitzschia fraudulenta, Strain WWA7" /LENGTH=197 /DNA_ID=CAMNT_0047405525 /DNA_START=151 /DNA_END=744 /DNA_ORIENTATION=-
MKKPTKKDASKKAAMDRYLELTEDEQGGNPRDTGKPGDKDVRDHRRHAAKSVKKETQKLYQKQQEKIARYRRELQQKRTKQRELKGYGEKDRKKGWEKDRGGQPRQRGGRARRPQGLPGTDETIPSSPSLGSAATREDEATTTTTATGSGRGRPIQSLKTMIRNTSARAMDSFHRRRERKKKPFGGTPIVEEQIVFE